jgi:uncharacterized protein (DUF433 family)
MKTLESILDHFGAGIYGAIRAISLGVSKERLAKHFPDISLDTFDANQSSRYGRAHNKRVFLGMHGLMEDTTNPEKYHKTDIGEVIRGIEGGMSAQDLKKNYSHIDDFSILKNFRSNRTDLDRRVNIERLFRYTVGEQEPSIAQKSDTSDIVDLVRDIYSGAAASTIKEAYDIAGLETMRGNWRWSSRAQNAADVISTYVASNNVSANIAEQLYDIQDEMLTKVSLKKRQIIGSENIRKDISRSLESIEEYLPHTQDTVESYWTTENSTKNSYATTSIKPTVTTISPSSRNTFEDRKLPENKRLSIYGPEVCAIADQNISHLVEGLVIAQGRSVHPDIHSMLPALTEHVSVQNIDSSIHFEDENGGLLVNKSLILDGKIDLGRVNCEVYGIPEKKISRKKTYMKKLSSAARASMLVGSLLTLSSQVPVETLQPGELRIDVTCSYDTQRYNDYIVNLVELGMFEENANLYKTCDEPVPPTPQRKKPIVYSRNSNFIPMPTGVIVEE